jgi:hypothetical protein
MKYSMKCLDKALLLILPDSDQWPKSIQRPTRLDMAAKELFMASCHAYQYTGPTMMTILDIY